MEKIDLIYNSKVLGTVDPDIRELEINGLNITKIGDIQNLNKLNHLEALFLDHNAIREIEGLDSLSQLERLYLGQNEITKITGLEQLAYLRILDLQNNPITHLEGLDHQTRLVTLNMSSTQISEISGLEKAGNLQNLSFNWCNLTRIKGLENAQEIVSLSLFANKIETLQGVDNLVKLTHLNLNRNQVRAIECLDGLRALRTCELGENRIKQIENLDHLENLERLDLHGNQITQIKGLDSLINLEELDLRRNRIRTVSGLGRLNKLCSLRLGLNPLPKEVRYLMDNDDEKGYVYNPQLFVTLCNGEKGFMQSLAAYKTRNVEAGNDDPLAFGFNDLERTEFIAYLEGNLFWPTVSSYSHNFELAEYYLSEGDHVLAQKHADAILKNEELVSFLKGKGTWKRQKLEYVDNKLSYKELEKTRGLFGTYLFTSLFFGDRAATREWIDVIINACRSDSKVHADADPVFLLALLLIRAYDELASREDLRARGKDDRVINMQYYIGEFANRLSHGKFPEARTLYQEYLAQVRKQSMSTIFSDISHYFACAVIFKDCLDDAEKRPSKYIFRDK